MTPSLTQTQSLFWKLISAPEGAADGLEALTAEERRTAIGLVRDDERLTAVDRWDIYANMYFFRILDVMKEDFPALLAVVGEDRFHNLITDYLLTHPSSHFSLRYIGQHLASFLESHALTTQSPFLPDLARFEWAQLDAFDASDAPPISANELAMVEADDWPRLHFELSASLRLLESAWPVTEIWRAARDGELSEFAAAKTVPSPLAPRVSAPLRCPVRVWRQNMEVWHRTITMDEADALLVAADGASFAEICDRIAVHTGEDLAAGRAVTLLQTWVADGLLVGCHVE